MLSLNQCHLLNLIMHIKRNQPINALRQVRTSSSAALRPVAAGTHPKTLSRRVFRFRDAPNNTIAPRLFASGTHLILSRSASPRRSSVTELRPGRTWTWSGLRPHAGLLLLYCVLYFQLPLILVCLYIVPCHPFLTVLPFSSISSSVMMTFSPFDMVPKLCSCIPWLYVQACYMHNILHVSYSSCNNQ